MISRFCLDINGVSVFVKEYNELILKSMLVYNKVKSHQCNDVILRLKFNNIIRDGASFLITIKQEAVRASW